MQDKAIVTMKGE